MKKLTLILFLALFTVACGHSNQGSVKALPQNDIHCKDTSGKSIAMESGIFAKLKPKSARKSKEQIERTNKEVLQMIKQAEQTQPLGKQFPQASLEACGDLSVWNDRSLNIKVKITHALSAMSVEENKDCEWAERYLQCRGVFESTSCFKDIMKSQSQTAKEVYLGCQK